MKVKTLFFEQLKPFFKENGYQFRSGYAPRILLKKEDYLVQSSFNFFSQTNKIYGGILTLSINAVENIILEIQYPNQGFSCYIEKEDYFSTLGDIYGKIEFDGDQELNSMELIIDYTNAIKKYIKTDGVLFIKKYCYLPNILAEIDQVDAENGGWHNLIAGSLDVYFRVLIISKLCNDPNFEHKIEVTDKVFYDNREKWIPYYEKLKERLKTIEPIY